MTVASERLQTARAIGRVLGTVEGRDFLVHNGHVSGTPIIACEWDTSLDEVIQNLRAANPQTAQAAVAIRRGEGLHWMGISPSSASDAGKDGDVHAGSTMGMLYQALQESGLSLRVTNLSVARAMVLA
ncbi:hypothetical protein NMQ01_09255 [Janibacter sp. CX7]|uniref:hypothetical protein n=1 Tax=Janibacter sp. CX7 TaxID=2963431 RepID=UPI0020CDD590|nr:hypothetical protein [Janibacter sp. CX7]UTT64922.1 hypothetical protein NMQ01_09255 [Janibacter sp. CX7]